MGYKGRTAAAYSWVGNAALDVKASCPGCGVMRWDAEMEWMRVLKCASEASEPWKELQPLYIRLSPNASGLNFGDVAGCCSRGPANVQHILMAEGDEDQIQLSELEFSTTS